MNSVKTQAMMWTLTLITLSITAGKSSSDESLLKRFIQHLFQLPGIQSKITEQMSTAATVANAVTKNNSDSGEETVSAQTATSLSQSVEKLAFAVTKLNAELITSHQRCEDLEQYSRRNDIIVSYVPVNGSSSLETQVVNMLNEPTEIERTHRIYRKASRTTSDRPPDIIVKFQSYRTRARLLTKDAMVQLREASEDTSDKDKMFISEDLTTVRKELFFKTRTLKKQGHIKSTFTRDGKIIVKLADDDTKWYITTQSDLKAMCTKFKLPLPQLTKKTTRTIQENAMDLDSQPLILTQATFNPKDRYLHVSNAWAK